MSDSSTQSVCKHCGAEIKLQLGMWVSRFPGSLTSYGYCQDGKYKPHEPVAEPASTGEPPREGCLPECFVDTLSSPNHWIEHAEGCPNNQPQHIATEIYNHENQTVRVERAARPSEPAAPQTDVPYLKRCAAEGWDCGCVDVCKFAAAPQPVSGDAPKVEEIARQIAAIGSETAWLSKGPRSKEWFIEQTALYLSLALRRYFPPASQTPPRCKHCDGLENGFLHRNGPVSTNYHDFEPATPASTVRKSPDSHLGAVRD